MEWTAGQKIHHDKYIIEKELGRGGFGVVYKAIHTGLNHPVVIKVPFEGFISYFDEEIQILATISNQLHPHIVRVRDQFYYEDRTPCLVMDFVEGENLFDLLRNRGSALFEVEAVRLISEIGDALAFMHENGLVHRDVNPKNIILKPDGRAVLIDFGTARRIATNPDDTPGNAVPTADRQLNQYTKAFAPYEQILGKNDCLPTVDIYSLAATVYYLVTKEQPELAIDREIYNRQLIEPKQYAEISSRLNKAIIDGMKLDAKDRPQSMREWLNLLTKGSNLELNYSRSRALELNTNHLLLEDLLSKRKWAKADRETSRLILMIANRETQGWLNAASWQDFPCGELKKIDELWINYSRGYFGFSVQRDIWRSVKGDWVQFLAKLGWSGIKHLLVQIYSNLFREAKIFRIGQFPTIAKPLTGILLGRHPDNYAHNKLIDDIRKDCLIRRVKIDKDSCDLLKMINSHSKAKDDASSWMQVIEVVQHKGDNELLLKGFTKMNNHLHLASELESKIQELSKVRDSATSELLNLEAKIETLLSIRNLGIELLISKLDSCDRDI